MYRCCRDYRACRVWGWGLGFGFRVWPGTPPPPPQKKKKTARWPKPEAGSCHGQCWEFLGGFWGFGVLRV